MCIHGSKVTMVLQVLTTVELYDTEIYNISDFGCTNETSLFHEFC